MCLTKKPKINLKTAGSGLALAMALITASAFGLSYARDSISTEIEVEVSKEVERVLSELVIKESEVETEEVTEEVTLEVEETEFSLDELIRQRQTEDETVGVDNQHVLSIRESANSGTTLLMVRDGCEIYHSYVVELSEDDRDLLERLVMGEAGTEGYIGACLVAQAIRDAITYYGYTSIENVILGLQYKGRTDEEPNEDVKKAVAYIFDEGGMAVSHKILYFYSYEETVSDFHESQHYVITYGSHKFFDRAEEE